MELAMETTGDTVQVQLGHPTELYKFKMQPLVLTRPESGIAKRPVTCNVCGREITVAVSSRSAALRFTRGARIVTLIVATLFVALMLWFVLTDPFAAASEPGLVIFIVIAGIVIAGIPFVLPVTKNRLQPMIRMTGTEAAVTLTVGSLGSITGRHRLLNPNGSGLLSTERTNGASRLAIRFSQGEP